MITIHRKITFAFSSLAVLFIGGASLAFLDLVFLERQIEQVTVVTKLEATIQDMRREEKNLFLYQDTQQAGQATLAAADAATQLLAASPQIFATVGNKAQLERLQSGLDAYQQSVRLYLLRANAIENGLVEQIREQGREASQLAEAFAQQEYQLLNQMMTRVKWAQLGGMVLLFLLLLLIGWLLDRSVITPLKRLMAELQPIAEGRFQRLAMPEHDVELPSLRTALNRLFDELENRRRRLVQSEKLAALGTLVSGVAHELNNPLSNISSSAQLLLEELEQADKDTLRTWAQMIDSETERARAIVTELQTFGRRKEPHCTELHLADLVERTLLLLQGDLRQTGAVVHHHIPVDLTVLADAQRLQQVLINLLRNAAQSSTQVTINIAAQRCSFTPSQLPNDATVVGELGCQVRQRQPMVEIRLEDNGAGIPAEALPHIFEPFYTTRSPRQGMGLGLYLVQEIIREHDGCIAIMSQAGQGTSVILRLPCRDST